MLTSSEWFVCHAKPEWTPVIRNSCSLLHRYYCEVVPLCTRVVDTNVEAVAAEEKPEVGTAVGPGVWGLEFCFCTPLCSRVWSTG